MFDLAEILILLKPRISAKTTYILRIIKYCKSQVPEKSHYHYLCKIKEKKFFFCGEGEGIGSKLAPGPASKDHHKFINSTIHLDAKFQLLGICRSQLYPVKQLCFLVQDQTGAIFGGSGAIPPVKNVRLSWYFDHSYT